MNFDKKINTYILILTLFLLTVIGNPVFAFKDEELVLPSIEVTDQNGIQHDFYNDLIKDKVVAINFVFTKCTMICPMLGYQFGQLQRKLQNDSNKQSTEKLESLRDVQLISISTDPLNDTPQRLQEWSTQFKSDTTDGPNWTLVTGDTLAINALLKSLNSFTADINEHSSLVILGNDKLNQWTRVEGTSSANLILETLKPWL